MKIFKLTIVFTCITINILSQTNDIDSILFKQYSSEKILTDLEFIKDKVITKNYNRTPYLFLSQDKFNQQYDSIVQVILKQGKMSLVDFYMLLTPFLNSICDDHLTFPLIGKWFYEDRRNPKVYDNNILWPGSAIIMDGDIYITCGKYIPQKSRLVTINNIPCSQINKQIVKYSSYSMQRYYELHGILPVDLGYYSLQLHSLYNLRDSISVKYKQYNSEKIEEVSIPLAKFYDINAVSQCLNNNKLSYYELKFKKNTAILRLNGFYYQDFNKTILLYNEIFDSIKNNGSENLIIDISQNGGGSDINWITLLKYLTKEPLQLNCKAPKSQISEVLEQMKIDQSKIDSSKMFMGNLYLIIGAKTFSSAVRFADVVKSNGVCKKIFGQETLGQATHYGQLQKYYLPNTQLELSVSTKLFFSISCSNSKTGVIPDQIIQLRSIDDYINYSKNEYTIEQTINMIK